LRDGVQKQMPSWLKVNCTANDFTAKCQLRSG
jgi:hypothetical protein